MVFTTGDCLDTFLACDTGGSGGGICNRNICITPVNHIRKKCLPVVSRVMQVVVCGGLFRQGNDAWSLLSTSASEIRGMQDTIPIQTPSPSHNPVRCTLLWHRRRLRSRSIHLE